MEYEILTTPNKGPPNRSSQAGVISLRQQSEVERQTKESRTRGGFYFTIHAMLVVLFKSI